MFSLRNFIRTRLLIIWLKFVSISLFSLLFTHFLFISGIKQYLQLRGHCNNSLIVLHETFIFRERNGILNLWWITVLIIFGAGKEYSKGDSRYAARDAATVTVEGLTAVLEGPASLLAVYDFTFLSVLNKIHSFCSSVRGLHIINLQSLNS